jgi:hypothetical protein
MPILLGRVADFLIPGRFVRTAQTGSARPTGAGNDNQQERA